LGNYFTLTKQSLTKHSVVYTSDEITSNITPEKSRVIVTETSSRSSRSSVLGLCYVQKDKPNETAVRLESTDEVFESKMEKNKITGITYGTDLQLCEDLPMDIPLDLPDEIPDETAQASTAFSGSKISDRIITGNSKPGGAKAATILNIGFDANNLMKTDVVIKSVLPTTTRSVNSSRSTRKSSDGKVRLKSTIAINLTDRKTSYPERNSSTSSSIRSVGSETGTQPIVETVKISPPIKDQPISHEQPMTDSDTNIDIRKIRKISIRSVFDNVFAEMDSIIHDLNASDHISTCQNIPLPMNTSPRPVSPKITKLISVFQPI